MNFLERLQRQKNFLERSVQLYDEGHKDEAIRIAVTLRVLLHDTGASKSLLSHLGIKESVQILTTLKDGFSQNPATGVMVISVPLWLDSNGERTPPLDSVERNEFVSVKEWWEQVVMGSNQLPTRKDIIRAAADQDGGAHVDANPGETACELMAGVGTFTVMRNGVKTKMNLVNHHFPLIRQFAYEILGSPTVWLPLQTSTK